MTTMVNGINGPRRRTPLDGWFRYAAGFSTESLASCVEAVRPENQDNVRVADPFVGVGTAARAAVDEGWQMRGIEAHPLIARIAALKFTCPETPAGLVEAAEKVLASCGPGDIDHEADLVRRMFAPAALSELVGLRTAIARCESPWRDHLELALISMLRDHASAKAGWPYQLPARERTPRSTDPHARFRRVVKRFAYDLDTAPTADVTVVQGDSRLTDAWSRAGAVELDGVITSPPYLNNYDYADATRLELYFLGEVTTWRELCVSVRDGMVIASTQQSRRDPAADAAASLSSSSIGETVGTLSNRLEVARKRPGPRDGKHYHWLVPLYFRDLSLVIENMGNALRSGGRVALVVGDSAPYGVYVDTPALLTKLAEDAGFRSVSAATIRSRGARWRTNGTRHQIPLREDLLVWER